MKNLFALTALFISTGALAAIPSLSPEVLNASRTIFVGTVKAVSKADVGGPNDACNMRVEYRLTIEVTERIRDVAGDAQSSGIKVAKGYKRESHCPNQPLPPGPQGNVSDAIKVGDKVRIYAGAPTSDGSVDIADPNGLELLH